MASPYTAVEVRKVNMLIQKAKVHPRTLHPSTPTYFTSKQEIFTIWIKSLVMSGNGCTVFDSNGHVVYRVDNYNCKYCNEVQLMEFQGRVLFTILRKKSLLKLWEGYRSWTSGAETENKRPSFQVRPKIFNMLRRDDSYKVVVGFDQNEAHPYQIENRVGKLRCKIVNKQSGELIAEVFKIVMIGFDDKGRAFQVVPPFVYSRGCWHMTSCVGPWASHCVGRRCFGNDCGAPN